MSHIRGEYYKTKTDGTLYLNNLDGNLLCHKCLCYLDLTNFYNVSRGIPELSFRQGKEYCCKSCKLQRANVARKATQKRHSSLDIILKERMQGVYQRAKKSSLDVSINIEYLRDLWYKQEGKCAVSGIPMTVLVYSGRIPTNVSVDRIDSSKGYTTGNVQLVCMVVNQMKGDLSIENLLYFVTEILKNNKELKKMAFPPTKGNSNSKLYPNSDPKQMDSTPTSTGNGGIPASLKVKKAGTVNSPGLEKNVNLF